LFDARRPDFSEQQHVPDRADDPVNRRCTNYCYPVYCHPVHGAVVSIGCAEGKKKSAGHQTKTAVGGVLIIKDREKVMENVAIDENWKTCFSQLAPGLVLFARQWTRSAADAEDVVQEAFVKFWRRNHDIANRGLLYATVRSVALDLLRRDSRRARREATALSDADQSVQPTFEIEDDSQRAMVGAIDLLPGEQREVLVMKIWNDLTFAEIGSALGISQNTAASRYRYALAALKKNLGST
jgi:RNA polymerase sigma-70 factor (ECF subfamily)